MTTRLWDTETGQLLSTLTWDAVPDRFASDTVENLTFSPDGKTLVCAGSGRFQLWDAHARGVNRQPLSIFADIYADTIAFSPDGKTLAIGWSPIRLFDIETGKLRLALAEHPHPITSLVFSSDGKTLASSGGGIVVLWDWHKIAQPKNN